MEQTPIDEEKNRRLSAKLRRYILGNIDYPLPQEMRARASNAALYLLAQHNNAISSCPVRIGRIQGPRRLGMDPTMLSTGNATTVNRMVSYYSTLRHGAQGRLLLGETCETARRKTKLLRLPGAIAKASDALTGVEIRRGDGWELLAGLKHGALAVVDPAYWSPANFASPMHYSTAALSEYTAEGFFDRLKKHVMPGWLAQRVRFVIFNRSSADFNQGMEDLGFKVYPLLRRNIGGSKGLGKMDEMMAVNYELAPGARLRACLTHPDPERLPPARVSGPEENAAEAAHGSPAGHAGPAVRLTARQREKLPARGDSPAAASPGDPLPLAAESPDAEPAHAPAAGPAPDEQHASYETLVPHAALAALQALPDERRNARGLLKALSAAGGVLSEAERTTIRGYSMHLAPFDGFLESRGGIAPALRNFTELARAAFAYREAIAHSRDTVVRIAALGQFCRLCFPVTPALLAFREAMQKPAWEQLDAQARDALLAKHGHDPAAARAAAGETAWQRLGGFQRSRALAVTCQFDQHLALRNLHIDTLLRDPSTAAARFILESRALLALFPDTRIAAPLRQWRQAAFPLELDSALAERMAALGFMPSTLVTFRSAVSHFAEYAHVHRLDKESFFARLHEPGLRAELLAWCDDARTAKHLLINLQR